MHTEPIRSRRHLCRLCGQHPCGFRTPAGRWVARRDHDVCARCWEGLRDAAQSRERALREQEAAAWAERRAG